MDWLVGLLDSLSPVRAVLAFVIVFFLPGFAWTFIFFRKLHPLERAALSFGLSIAIVTLGIIVMNVLLDMRINGVNSLLTILAITVVPLPLYYLLKRIRKPVDTPPEDEE